MKIENVLINLEEKLSMGAALPFVGVVPAVVKIGMGAGQSIAGIACSIIFSTALIFNPDYKSLRDRSISHIIHGGANIGAGFLEGIPVLGFVLFLLRIVKSKPMGPQKGKLIAKVEEISDSQKGASSFQNFIRKKPNNYLLISPNHFNFIGYKVLQEDTDTFYQEEHAYYKSLNSSSSVEEGADSESKIKVAHKEFHQAKNPNDNFFEPIWQPILFV